MAAQISRDYPRGPLYLIAILKGAFIFLADLARAIETPTRIEFIGISSYGRGKMSSGEVRVTKDLDVSIEGYDVLVVDGHEIQCLAVKEGPAALPWKALVPPLVSTSTVPEPFRPYCVP